jgi:hypothetical protein
VQLYVIAILSDWAFLEDAYAGGQQYPAIVIDRDVGSGGGIVYETVAVNLTTAQAREFAQGSGFSVKLTGQHGSVIVDVPAGYFGGFLEVLESQR